MSLVRVHNFTVSLDGYGTGAGQTRTEPFGHAGEALHEWMFDTAWGREGGTRGIEDSLVRRYDSGFGAESMGAGKFGFPGWENDPEWKGPWGANPPFHTPVFVLTRHTRPSIEMEGGTTYHFIDPSPAEALAAAREAAGGLDVRLGGGPSVVRDFVKADLVDFMHIAVAPMVLGRGVSVWEGLERLELRFDIESVTAPSGVTHLTFTRKVG
jgi:dihydrofolate reductase